MSTNQYAAFHRINPATVAKAFQELVDDGLLYKKRGLGMFVTPGAGERLRAERRAGFVDDVLAPAVAEAARLSIPVDERRRRHPHPDQRGPPVNATTTIPGPTAASATTTHGHTVELRDLSVRFGTTTAVDAVTTTIAGGTIVGLLGRNGAGKSTLLSTIAAYRRPTSGTVRVDGADPYEDPG